MEYRREIDGLRALAVLPVMLFHAGFTSWFGGGFVGVDVFFVISGYLVTGIILAEKEAGHFSIVRFYERRARRILPALFVVVLATLPFAWMWLLPSHLAQFWRSLLALPLFAANFLFWQESGYFEGAAELKPLLHTWSLAVEEQYYLLFPLALLLAWRLGRRRLMALLLLAAAGSLAAAQWGSLHKPAAAYFLLPARGWELLVGSMLALHARGRRPRATLDALSELGSLLGLGMLAYAVVGLDKKTPFPGLHALWPTLGAALLILFATPHTLVGRLLASRPLVGIGLLSYSAYLWHQPLFALARHRSTTELSGAWLGALLLLTLALAYLSWRCVEQPFRQGRRFSRAQVFGGAAAASALLGALGLAGVAAGLKPAYSEAELQIAGHQESRELYTWQRMDALQLKAFAPGAYKVLVIGDSQAGDFVNVLHESRPLPQVSFSTYTIPWSCGNLYLHYSIADEIEPGERAKCQAVGGYRDARLQALLRQADQVLLVSLWRPWHLKHLGASLANLRADYGDKFTVVGAKSFQYRMNRPALAALAALGPAQRRQATLGVDESIARTNDRLRERFGAVFYDLAAQFCDTAGRRCRLFDDDGHVIPYDDTHVTPEGARFVGRHLARDPRFAPLFPVPAQDGDVVSAVAAWR